MGTSGTGPAGPAWLDEHLAADRVLLIDGATGSELERRGVPMHAPAWCSPTTLTHPDVLRAVHEDYIRAGARVIIANTFSAGRHILEPAGLGDRVVEINRRAVEIAREARDAAATEPVAVAGSVSSHMLDPLDPHWLEPERLRATYREQIGGLVEGGADLIALEMMQRVEVSVPALEEALATGLPVWVGVSPRVHEDGRITCWDYADRPFDDTCAALARPEVGAFTVMHTSVPETAPGLEAVRRHWSGPLGAYPECGYYERPHWHFVDVIDPGDLAREALAWVEGGLRIVGGCCGLGPEHIRALRDALADRL